MRTNPNPWTNEVKATVRTMFPTATWPELLAALAPMSQNQIWRVATSLGLKRQDQRKCIDHQAVAEQLKTAAAHADGCTLNQLAEVGPFKHCTIAKIAGQLIATGQIHRLIISARQVRYFTDADSAQRYMHRLVSRPVANKVIHGVRGPAYLPGDPVITPATRWTIAPPPPARTLRTNTHMFSA